MMFNPIGTMLELFEYAVIGAIVLLGNLLGLYIAFKVASPRLRKSLRGEAMNIGNQVGAKLAETIENVDVGEIIGQIGAGEGGTAGMAGLSGLAEQFGIDLGPLSALSGLAGGKTKKGDHHPGR